MKANTTQIRAWAKAGNVARFRFDYNAAKDIGFGVVRSTGKLTNFQKVRVVLEATTKNKRLYFILTAFPIP